MNKLTLWLFRFSALATSAAMVFAFTRVWWTARVGELIVYPQGDYWVHIFAWGIKKKAETADVVGISNIVTDTTPSYQTVLAWFFLAMCVGLLLWGTWLRGWKGSLLQVVAGLAYTSYAWVALHVVIAKRIHDIGVLLSGVVDRGDPLSPYEAQMSVLVHTDIGAGWYVAVGAGIFCVVLAMVHFLTSNTKATANISG